MNELLIGKIGIAPHAMLFADDVVLVWVSVYELETDLHVLTKALEKKGLKVSIQKTELMVFKFSKRDGKEVRLKIEQEKIKNVENFQYLGSVIENNVVIDGDIINRACTRRLKWKAASGVLCDRHISVRVKGVL